MLGTVREVSATLVANTTRRTPDAGLNTRSCSVMDKRENSGRISSPLCWCLRKASAVSFASQAVALLIMINARNEATVFFASALFGFSVGNVITLPALIIQREFDPRSFGVLVSLTGAIGQCFNAFGPGIIGLLRDASGSYELPFYGCIGLELAAAVLILVRGRRNKTSS